MKTSLLTVCVCFAAAMAAGCFSAKAPDNIYIGGGPRAADVDSSDIPRTRSHEQAKAELVKAYQQIRYLEDQHDRCKDKLEEARERGEEYESKYKRLKDKYDD